MNMVDRFAQGDGRKRFNTGSRLYRTLMKGLRLLAICSAATAPSWAQSTPPKTAPTGGGSAPSQDGSGAAGFSIESEMLTYRALESNSEAVACDLAAYLTGGSAEFGNPSKGVVCTVKGGNDRKERVVIVPSDSTTLDNFRLWRADMEIMGDLNFRASGYCPDLSVVAVYNRSSTPATTPTTPDPTPGAAFFTPAGSALSLAQNVIGLFSSQTSTAPVSGEIRDQAFMDGVARELRSFGIAVLMPGIFIPSSLNAADVSRSPFLSSLDRLILARICLKDLGAKSNTSIVKANIAQITSEIDAYVDTFRGGTPRATPPQPSAANSPDGGTSSAATTVQRAPTAGSASSLLSILSADDLAQKLGTDPATGLPMADSPWKHVLLLKTLESGGTVIKTSNILGTKIRYSGGAVGTYSLFTLDGELECSGNVYAYGGSVPAKKFQDELRRYTPDPSSQFIFHRGSCRAPASH